MSGFIEYEGVIGTTACPRCGAEPGTPCDTPKTGLLDLRDDDGQLLAWCHGCCRARFLASDTKAVAEEVARLRALERVARQKRDAELGAQWLSFLDAAGTTPERVALSRARAIAKMREASDDQWVVVERGAGPLTTPEHLVHRRRDPERDHAFARFVDAQMQSLRASRLGPRPRRWRLLKRWRWNRQRRQLECDDAKLIAGMIALYRSGR